jgi:hypothetical protein
MHPAIAGLPVPERFLPPAASWARAQRLGLTASDGRHLETARVAANPKGHPAYKTQMKWAGGPTPPRLKSKGAVVGPGDAARTVYLWFVNQASMRLSSIQEHILDGEPSVAELVYAYSTERGTVQRWIKAIRDKAKEVRKLDKISFPEAVASLEVPQPVPFSPRDLRLPMGTIYFVSGAKNPGEIEGVARLAARNPSVGVGIDVSKCNERCMLALELVAERHVPLFVDSGAFSEKGGEPISDAEWKERLKGYRGLAELFGIRANLVAPDKVGSQRGTKARLLKYGALLRTMAHEGAWILVAAQKGKLPRHKFWDQMRSVLVSKGVPREKIVAAFPLVKSAMSMGEIKDFAEFFGGDVGRYHLLGRGPLKERLFNKTLGAIWAGNDRAVITSDSTTMVSGMRGKAELLGVVPKLYTYAQDIVRYEVMFEAFQRSYRGGETMEGWVNEIGWGEKDLPDYTDHAADVDHWLPKRFRKVLANWLEARHKRWGGTFLTSRQRELLCRSPSEWLTSPMHEGEARGPKWYDDYEVEAWLDDQWTRFLGSYFAARVKRDAMARAYNASLVQMRMIAPGVLEGVDLAFGEARRR